MIKSVDYIDTTINYLGDEGRENNVKKLQEMFKKQDNKLFCLLGMPRRQSTGNLINDYLNMFIDFNKPISGTRGIQELNLNIFQMKSDKQMLIWKRENLSQINHILSTTDSENTKIMCYQAKVKVRSIYRTITGRGEL